jgi:pyrimidine operon attenuation protein / uracil phosphoribosyltransferase
MEVLNHSQIKEKIKRLSYQILENNLDSTEIIIAGINNNGFGFASLLIQYLNEISNKKWLLKRIKLNPADPVNHPITIDMEQHEMVGKSFILVDDVANTGRTIFYAYKVLMQVLVSKIEVAVMVDRKHKLFPIKVDYVGLSLATTVQDNIQAHLLDENHLWVTLS